MVGLSLSTTKGDRSVTAKPGFALMGKVCWERFEVDNSIEKCIYIGKLKKQNPAFLGKVYKCVMDSHMSFFTD